MRLPRKTWREKRLAQEERDSENDSDQGANSGSGDLDINMVFELPAEFWAPEMEVEEMVQGVRLASFEKPERLGQHMKPLFIKWCVEGKPV
jgi:hypothetical protein